ncbi:protein CUSTOS [Ctenodactylus gundi]
MAAPSGAMSDSESSSSSSDAEELARCREAAMPAWGLEERPRGEEKPRADAARGQRPPSWPSLRCKVDEHEQDGNELQTTPEFRAHVARKLGALLDSSITISEAVEEPRKAQAQKGTLEDDGFRLFFTSIPGARGEEAAPPSRRKRQPSSCSSEDSAKEWQRCREAAVSASDILQDSAIHSPVQVKEEGEKKKKLTKKAKKVASGSLAQAAAPSCGAMGQKQEESGISNGNQLSLGAKKKKRKKKAKKAGDVASCPSVKGTASVPAS